MRRAASAAGRSRKHQKRHGAWGVNVCGEDILGSRGSLRVIAGSSCWRDAQTLARRPAGAGLARDVRTKSDAQFVRDT